MRRLIATGFAIMALLAGCGGGGGGSSPGSSSSLTITGVAATGAAIRNGAVDVKCKSGTGSGLTNPDGSYSVSVSGGTLPCMLRATDPVSTMVLHSVVEDGANKANITPITELVAANLLGVAPAQAFSGFDVAAQQKITPTALTTAVGRVQAATAGMSADADLSGVDVMKGNFQAATSSAGGDATDKKIDALMAALAAADKRIQELTEQLKSASNALEAASKLTAVVGAAKYALNGCPYARSGDVWVFDMIGSTPVVYSVDFNLMKLTRTGNSTPYAITPKLDGNGAVVPCAFTSIIDGVNVEYRVSEGGIGAWVTATDFGLFVPVQRSKQLVDPSFAGTYPAMMFIKDKASMTRMAVPGRFEINAQGNITGYSCNPTKTMPDCQSPVSTSGDTTTCTAAGDGSYDCTAPGMAAKGVLYLTGSQATLVMAVTNYSHLGWNFGGLLVMTKAAEIRLPTAGQASAAGSGWSAGVYSGGSSTVYSSSSLASTIQSVNASANSYERVVSTTPNATTYTSYINVPAYGMRYSTVSNGFRGIDMNSPSGWGVSMYTNNPSVYDGWMVSIRAMR